MRRALLPVLLLLLAASPSVALAAAAGAGAPTVAVLDCVSALDPVARTATFQARVRAVRASTRMQVRFTLQVRDEGMSDWRRVVAEGLDTWLTSDPGVRRYTYDKSVQNLTAPAAYRAVVRFRWLDASGAALKDARRTSPVCRQSDLRPDLSAERIAVTPGIEPGTSRYAVRVRNRGQSPSGASTVALRVGAQMLPLAPVPGLAAHEQQVLAFIGPKCTAGEPLEVTVDPDAVVDERDETDNVLLAACPER